MVLVPLANLQKKVRIKAIAYLEGGDAMGGTWEIFKYPGVRSDSDMFTLGYNFKPWTSSQFLADGPAILDYIKEAAEDHQVHDKIRYKSWVTSIEWDSTDANWTITYGSKSSKNKKQLTCNMITGCTGYYSYKGGYTPKFPGIKKFEGTVVHPQKWPEGMDYKDKKIIVIGSGATAVTLVPELSKDAAHVTMLQRSPTYMAAVPGVNPLAEVTRKLLPEKMAYRVSRTQNIALTYAFFYGSRQFPKQIRKVLLAAVKRNVGDKVDMKHFQPNYNVWEERLCAVKSGEFFQAVTKRQDSIVTDHITGCTSYG